MGPLVFKLCFRGSEPFVGVLDLGASDAPIDRGPDGVAATLDVMDGAGLGHAGTARDSAEAAAGTILEVRGLRIALLSYATD